MIFSTKKFNKEITALPELNQLKNVLTSTDQARIKQSILLAIAQEDTATKPGFWTRHRLVLRYSVSAALGLSLVAGTAFASGNAIPGDILYPVKITTEKVQLSLASTDQSKAQLQAQFAQQRIVELQKLTAKNTPPTLPPPPPQIIAATSGTQALISIASSTPAAVSNQSPLEAQARIRASQEVNNALTALKSVQAKLQSHGDSKDAQSIANNITTLQTQAGAQHLLGSDVNKNNGQGNQKEHNENKNNQLHQATTTPPAVLRKPSQNSLQNNPPQSFNSLNQKHNQGH